ncbi:hypothetical protein IA54_020310 [Xanthomonas phaseoli pv. syngonii LMG 9055]|uniref:Uncharacterized protein n=1 Tax=Xanthomonas phaseoli pv. syngonii LMG 9055 TaxID=1437878 RepID=A0A1V9HI09_9XANT|nr:hypothetical protein IA54_020310 [Xanthomonas phaseoli pv. syngonii LMG 9055]
MYLLVAVPVAERMPCACAGCTDAATNSADVASTMHRAMVVILSMVFPLYALILAHALHARVDQVA